MVSPTIAVVYVLGYGGVQVPVFGGVNYTLMQPTSSPAPTGSGQPSVVPLLPPAVSAREKMASYFCGKGWNDVDTNCHSPCPSGSNDECKDPDHICWAFVETCKATMRQLDVMNRGM
jgi:hypothetical protein